MWDSTYTNKPINVYINKYAPCHENDILQFLRRQKAQVKR